MCVGMGNNGDCVGFGNDLERHFIGDSMKYISEERLETLLNNTSYITANDLLRVLINECIELNQCQPIESAPKDRKIMIFSDTYGWEFGWYNEKSDRWSYYPHKPKAWMEIPAPPK